MNVIAYSWSSIEKLIFRFAFSLLTLFMFFFSNGTIPLLYIFSRPLNRALNILTSWVGKNLLGIDYDVKMSSNGSGDTSFHYILLFSVVVFAVLSTIIWTVFDFKRKNYNRLFYWLTVCVRFYVGLMLINYGMVKVIQLQFPTPSLTRLITAYGDSSPMGLAWTFLGFSKGYNLFMGIAELAAVLLLFRKTITVGAIITLMTTANVMAVNYFYDVPVKIISTALVLMCLFLLAPNFKRLFKLFFMGQAVGLRIIEPPLFRKPWMKVAKYLIKYLVLAYTLLAVLTTVFHVKDLYGSSAPKSVLYGVYKVDKFIKNGEVIAIADSTIKWDKLIMEHPDRGSIKKDKQLRYFSVFTDTAAKQLKMVFSDSPNEPQVYTYQKRVNQLLLSGKIAGDSVQISLTKMKFLLMDRKLNWINETPYNR